MINRGLAGYESSVDDLLSLGPDVFNERIVDWEHLGASDSLGRERKRKRVSGRGRRGARRACSNERSCSSYAVGRRLTATPVTGSTKKRMLVPPAPGKKEKTRKEGSESQIKESIDDASSLLRVKEGEV